MRATLQRPQDTTNADGSVTTEWIDVVVDMPVGVVPQKSREFENASQIQADITHLVRARYLRGVEVLASWLMLLKDRCEPGKVHTLNLLAPPINVDMDNHEWRIMCKEPANG